MTIAAFILLAGIVSDDAKMFLSGGEWLPDAVPNEAFYDCNYEGQKDICLSSNIAAAVASCASGICERYVIGAESGTVWWEKYGPDVLGEETFKTNILWMHYTGWRENPIWLSYPTNRVISTYRLPHYEYVDGLRKVLKNVADGWWSDDYDYGIDDWGGKWWGSSAFETGAQDFPIWNWKEGSPVDDTYAFAITWPQFTNCTGDGIWRVSTNIMHGSVCEALRFFDFGPWNDLSEAIDAIYRMPSGGMKCFDVMSHGLGPNAAEFTNETRRILYYRLGAIEKAIAAMDTTYHIGGPVQNDFASEQRTYFHDRGFTNGVTQNVAVDWDVGTATITGDVQWAAYETWVTTTNDMRSYSHPAFICSGDTPRGHQSVVGSSRIEITHDMLDGLDIPENQQFAFNAHVIGGNLVLTDISIIQHFGELVISLPMSPWSATMVAGVTRRISVEYTDCLQTNIHERVTYPVPWAWNRGMVSADLRSLEYRVCCTNSLPEMEHSRYLFRWCGDKEHGEKAENRSAYVGIYSSTNSYTKAWRTERLQHNISTSNMLTDFLDCSLTDRESLIPIPPSPCETMKDEADKARTGSIISELDYDNFHVMRLGNKYLLDGIGSGGYFKELLENGSAKYIGRLQFTPVDKTDIDVSMRGRPPCFSFGDCKPVNKIKWRFSSLRKE